MNQFDRYWCWQNNYSSNKWRAVKLKYLLNYLYAVIVSTLKTKVSHNDKCDILILVKNNVDNFLERELQGFETKRQKILSVSDVAKNGCISGRSDAPLYHRIYALHANYLIEKYQPKIILTNRHGTVLSYYLKEVTTKKKITTIHIAHSIPTINYRKFGMIHYDYYLLYGNSSIDALMQFPMRLGNCKVRTVGAQTIDNSVVLNDTSAAVRPGIIILGSGPTYEANSNLEVIYTELISICEQRQIPVYFKPHPRSNMKLWDKLSARFSHYRHGLIKIDCISNVYSLSYAAFAAYTNAVIDVSCIGVPILWYADQDQVDYFSIESFFLTRMTSPTEISLRVDEVISNQSHYKKKTALFTKYHICAHGIYSKLFTETLNQILAEKEVPGTTTILQKL